MSAAQAAGTGAGRGAHASACLEHVCLGHPFAEHEVDHWLHVLLDIQQPSLCQQHARGAAACAASAAPTTTTAAACTPLSLPRRWWRACRIGSQQKGCRGSSAQRVGCVGCGWQQWRRLFQLEAAAGSHCRSWHLPGAPHRNIKDACNVCRVGQADALQVRGALHELGRDAHFVAALLWVACARSAARATQGRTSGLKGAHGAWCAWCMVRGRRGTPARAPSLTRAAAAAAGGLLLGSGPGGGAAGLNILVVLP